MNFADLIDALNLSLLELSAWLHVLATVIWFGGLTLLLLILYPLQWWDRSYTSTVEYFTRRFRPLATFSLVVLLVTGLMQLGQYDDSPSFYRFSDRTSQAILGKLIVLGLLLGLTAYLQFGVAPALARAQFLIKTSAATDAAISHLYQRQWRLLLLTYGLGWLVLLLTVA